MATTFKPDYIEALAGGTDQDLEDFASFLPPAQRDAFWAQITAVRSR